MISRSYQIRSFYGVVRSQNSKLLFFPLSSVVRLVIGVFFLIGSRSSNLLRHIYKGFLPAVCSLPVPGYMVIKKAVLLLSLH